MRGRYHRFIRSYALLLLLTILTVMLLAGFVYFNLQAHRERGPILDRSGYPLAQNGKDADGNAAIRKHDPLDIADPILGQTTANGKVQTGYDGLELAYEAQLSKGNRLYTTLNKDVQIAIQSSLKNHLENHSIQQASIAMMEVQTGKIVAISSIPDKASFGMDALLVGMGSTIKPLSVLIGLQEGLLQPDDQFDDEGKYQYLGESVQNQGSKANGILTPSLAIEVSSNTFVAAKVGIPFYNKYIHDPSRAIAIWKDYLGKFGLGVIPSSGLPNESLGVNGFEKEAVQNGALPALMNASWGQNEKYSALQLVRYASTLANRGALMKPMLVDKITDQKGQLLQNFEPTVLSKLVAPDLYWNLVFEGMKGASLDIDRLPFPVARKTGTSSEEKNGEVIQNSLCIAFAPMDKPKVAVAVIVPSGGIGAGIASSIAGEALEAYEHYVGRL